MPSAFDQFDNADIVEKLGVGICLKEHNLTCHNLIKGIRGLIDLGETPSVNSGKNGNRVSDFEASRHLRSIPGEHDLVRSRCSVLSNDINSQTNELDAISSVVMQFLN